MTFAVQAGLVLVVVGLLAWASASVNARFRPGDPVWQRTLRWNVAIGKGLATTGAIFVLLGALVALVTAIF